MSRLSMTMTLIVAVGIPSAATADDLDGWTFVPVRAEVSPESEGVAMQAPAPSPELTISVDEREGLTGAWVKTFAVKGGQHYRFSCLRETQGMSTPHRSAVAKITWLNAKGAMVFSADHDDKARPEFPFQERQRGEHLTELFDEYQVPVGVTQAKVELQLRWASQASVTWSQVRLETIDPPEPRIVRLASVHFRPRDGKTAADNCKQFAPLIGEAAQQRADLICLGESVTKVGNGLSTVETAEPIPGPSTEYFGKLSKKHNLYIVAGLTERDGTVIYNTSVLMGPEGELVGKYRKVCLPREESEGGVTPGSEYPVFDTRFGKVGMMICWDVQFPEVASALTGNGAEIIAMPIWGGNPRLAAARAIENQIYLISSSYSDKPDWMITGIWDHRGDVLAKAEDWGSVIVSEVDLNERTHWWYLGDLKARIYRERPATAAISK